ncbi:MAG TPA: DUF983 domain-containing protein [Actinomycetota bacterium]|nr:DUF983 domain-containing protein [Actinomycetota bacterium]
MLPARQVGFGVLLRRGLRKRCPVCGGKNIFSGWFSLHDHCPTCGYRFVREDGYWVSAIIVNMAVIEVLFLVVFMITVVATAPEVPWVPLVIIAAVMNILFPVFFFPYSKTVWMAVDLYFHPIETSEHPPLRKL